MEFLFLFFSLFIFVFLSFFFFLGGGVTVGVFFKIWGVGDVCLFVFLWWFVGWLVFLLLFKYCLFTTKTLILLWVLCAKVTKNL